MSRPSTMLDLVREVSKDHEDDREVVEKVLGMLRSGRVHLSGIFRGTRFEANGQGRETSDARRRQR
jgi:hypothetical protein